MRCGVVWCGAVRGFAVEFGGLNILALGSSFC